jgi:hypothetical protein
MISSDPEDGREPLLALDEDDGLDGPEPLRAPAIEGFARKRVLNRTLAEAQRAEPSLDFQTFVTRTRNLSPRI